MKRRSATGNPSTQLLVQSRRRVNRAHDPNGIPAEYWVFHKCYFAAYRKYAELHLGDQHLAGEVVHRLFLDLLIGWLRLMQHENPAAHAFACLKERVDAALLREHRSSTVAETALFGKVARAVLEDYRDEFAAAESHIGLYAAIAKLEGRQFDVVVLHYVLGYERDRVASIMGVTNATVRSHLSAARRRLEGDLLNMLRTDKK